VPRGRPVDPCLQAIRIKSLLAWLTIADECLSGKRYPLKRAARDYDRDDEIPQLITHLENATGRQLMALSKHRNFRLMGKRRSDHLLGHGVLLADIAAAIEHMLVYFQEVGGSAEAIKAFAPVKVAIFKGLEMRPARARERQQFAARRRPVPATGERPNDRADARLRIMRRQHRKWVRELGLRGKIFQARF
jgi:hypothetical protein